MTSLGHLFILDELQVFCYKVEISPPGRTKDQPAFLDHYFSIWSFYLEYRIIEIHVDIFMDRLNRPTRPHLLDLNKCTRITWEA